MTRGTNVGLVVGGCQLGELLGQGGMGSVYRATQLALQREVAVKLVPAVDADPSLIARFGREVRTAAALEHPHSIPIFAAGEEDGLLYLVMRLVHGPDLGALLNREGPLEASRALGLIEQVGSALDAAHSAGLVHRDVKPANILVEPSEHGEHAYLSDFGLMRGVADTTAITRVGEWVGSIDYVAPEQIEGREVDGRADVYALSGVLYTALTGLRPFPGATPAAIAQAHVSAPPPRLPAGRWPPALGAVIARGLAKAPDARYASAGELAAAARAALDGRVAPPTGSAPAGRRPGPGRPGASRFRARALAAALGLVALAALAVAVAVILSSGAGKPRRASAPPTPRSVPTAQFADAAFSFRYPLGWQLIKREENHVAYLRTEVMSPDGKLAVIVDRTPNSTLSPPHAAAAVQGATARTSRYVPVSYRLSTLDGRSAVIWEFELPDAPLPARIDIFQDVGSGEYAVLGEARQLSDIDATALAAASSLRAR